MQSMICSHQSVQKGSLLFLFGIFFFSSSSHSANINFIKEVPHFVLYIWAPINCLPSLNVDTSLWFKSFQRFFGNPKAFSENLCMRYFLMSFPSTTLDIACFSLKFLPFLYLFLISAMRASRCNSTFLTHY